MMTLKDHTYNHVRTILMNLNNFFLHTAFYLIIIHLKTPVCKVPVILTR